MYHVALPHRIRLPPYLFWPDKDFKHEPIRGWYGIKGDDHGALRGKVLQRREVEGRGGIIEHVRLVNSCRVEISIWVRLTVHKFLLPSWGYVSYTSIVVKQTQVHLYT